MPDAEIYNEPAHLQRIAKGDEQAFAAMVELRWRNVYLHALTYTRSPQKAEEVTQDIFLVIWKQRESLTEIENFTAWLNVVARNKIISALRSKLQVLASGLETDSDDTAIETLLVPDRQAEFRETYQVLLKGIELLPEKRKQVFKLSRLENKSNLEIAEQLNMHPVTVSQYLAKALVFLKTYLNEQQITGIVAIILLAGKA